MAEAAVANVPAKADAAQAKGPLLGLSFLENLADMSVLRQLGLLVGLAASVAIGFAVVLWSQQPDYRPLYGSLNGMDATQVVETLSASGIDYTVEPTSGALLVKADDLARARMRLAAAGVAPTDNSVGFEILDREQGLGTSQFMEATRYRRGLEGELARTVSSLNNVKAARVHLAMPKASVFVRDERKPSASVLVKYRPAEGRAPLNEEQVKAFVATAVPEMKKEYVTVLMTQALPPEAEVNPELRMQTVLGLRMLKTSADRFKAMVAVTGMLVLGMAGFTIWNFLRASSSPAAPRRKGRGPAAES